MEAMGLEPAGENGSWYQPFDIVGVDTKNPATTLFRKGSDSVQLKYHDEFIASSGLQQPEATLEDAELVFVGYGIVAPEYGWDDFKGVDLKGKVLVVMNNDPEDDPALFAGKTRLYYGRWTYKYEQAARTGAAGAIIIHTTPSAGYGWQVIQTSWEGEQFGVPQEGPQLQVKALGHRGQRAEARDAGRPGPRPAARGGAEEGLQAGPARRHLEHRARRTRSAAPRPRTCWAACRAAIPCCRRRRSSTRRTTTTSA